MKTILIAAVSALTMVGAVRLSGTVSPHAAPPQPRLIVDDVTAGAAPHCLLFSERDLRCDRTYRIGATRI